MEGKGRVGSSSSFTAELFGTKDPQPPSSSSGIFATIFPPPSKTGARHSPSSNHGSSGWRAESVNTQSRDSNGVFQDDRVQPCHLSSSLYYGGQDVYSRSTNQTYHHPVKKEHRREDDADGSNSHDASRGNWWQGSLYY